MFGKILAILCLSACITGCQTTTHHSNTMFFGTSTSLGVKVDVATSTTPKVNIGYDRNEALILPLLANKDFDENNIPEPCNNANIEECMFTGIQEENKDTYAVLATFGADITGKGGTGAEAAVGISQYFSSGHAAIELAKNGGAAAVSTGTAAQASAQKSALQAYLDSEAIRNEAAIVISNREKAHTDLLELVIASSSDTIVKTKMMNVDTNVFGGGTKMATACSTKSTCLSYLSTNKAILRTTIVEIKEAYSK